MVGGKRIASRFASIEARWAQRQSAAAIVALEKEQQSLLHSNVLDFHCFAFSGVLIITTFQIPSM